MALSRTIRDSLYKAFFFFVWILVNHNFLRTSRTNVLCSLAQVIISSLTSPYLSNTSDLKINIFALNVI